jgi:hypothetical protein
VLCWGWRLLPCVCHCLCAAPGRVSALATRTAAALCSSRPEPRAFGKHLQCSKFGSMCKLATLRQAHCLIQIFPRFEPEALYGRLLHSAAAVRFHLVEVSVLALVAALRQGTGRGNYYDFHSCLCYVLLGWWPKTLLKKHKKQSADCFCLVAHCTLHRDLHLRIPSNPLLAVERVLWPCAPIRAKGSKRGKIWIRQCACLSRRRVCTLTQILSTADAHPAGGRRPGRMGIAHASLQGDQPSAKQSQSARQPTQRKTEAYPAARACKISNAGKVLPSNTSKNAPPPVEM